MNETFERICKEVSCGSEFTTSKSQQAYCSYDCYVKSANTRSKDYYMKVREAGLLIPKICPNCHEHFETKKMRVKYCSAACYHEASLDKNRAYSQKIRDEYKAAHPKTYTQECSLCYNMYNYKTKQGKFCDSCQPFAKKLARGVGPINIPAIFKDLPVGETLSPKKTFACWLCEKNNSSVAKELCPSCEEEQSIK